MQQKSCSVFLQSSKEGEGRVLWRNVSVDSQAICLFRILFPILLLYDFFVNIFPYWDVLYGDHALVWASDLPLIVPWAFFNYVQHPFDQTVILLLYVFSLLALMVGFKPRIFCIVAFFIYFALNERNPYVMSNAEVLSRALLLWMCFLPLDRHWSISGALRGDSERNGLWPIVPVLAIKAQILVVYLQSGLWKLGSADWYSGKAIEYVASDWLYSNQFGHYFINLFPAAILFVLTWAVIIFQIMFSGLIYFPYKNDYFRAGALFCTYVMHASFIFCLNIYWFPYLCMAYLVLLFPDHWFDKFFRKRRDKFSQISIFYDPDCGFCRSIALIFREFCVGRTAKVMPASADAKAKELLDRYTSWVVFGHDGKIYMKWEAVSYLLKCSPVFWVLGWISGWLIFRKLFECLYDLIGRNRHRLGSKLGFILRPEDERVPDFSAQILCFICLVVMLSYSFLTLPQSRFQPNQALSLAAYMSGTQQTWRLFAPEVHKHHYIFSFSASDVSGRDLEVSGIVDRQFQVGNGGYITFPNTKFLKYYTFIFDDENLRNGLARYICYSLIDRNQPVQSVRIKMQRQSVMTNEPALVYDQAYMCDHWF